MTFTSCTWSASSVQKGLKVVSALDCKFHWPSATFRHWWGFPPEGHSRVGNCAKQILSLVFISGKRYKNFMDLHVTALPNLFLAVLNDRFAISQFNFCPVGKSWKNDKHNLFDAIFYFYPIFHQANLFARPEAKSRIQQCDWLARTFAFRWPIALPNSWICFASREQGMKYENLSPVKNMLKFPIFPTNKTKSYIIKTVKSIPQSPTRILYFPSLSFCLHTYRTRRAVSDCECVQ